MGIETHDYIHVSIRWIRISLLEIMHKYLPEGVSKELSMGHLPTTLPRVYSKFQLNIERARAHSESIATQTLTWQFRIFIEKHTMKSASFKSVFHFHTYPIIPIFFNR